MRIFRLFFLIVLLSSCSQDERARNVVNMEFILIGDSPNSVVHKMKSNPDKIVFSDSIYLNQEKIGDIITFIYHTPRLASSDIHIYFKDCEVLYLFFDN